MKKYWFKLNKWDKNLAALAIESGFQAFQVPKDLVKKLRELAVVEIISNSEDADLVIGKDVVEVEITKNIDEEKVITYGGKIPVIISNKDWTIIPLENLVSKVKNVIQKVHNVKEIEFALGALEIGADGILLETTDIAEIKKAGEIIKRNKNEKIELVDAEIISTKALGMGDRVAIDTSSILRPGQGVLVGNSSQAMFLAYNENVENPYCDPRPFRVNAGAVHAYILTPNDKTKYLSELKSGMTILAVDENGTTEEVIVGRVKIERRPMILVTAKSGELEFSIIMQNAETIRLTKQDGGFISIVKLKKGDKVRAYVQKEISGRHFGQRIKETIIEK